MINIAGIIYYICSLVIDVPVIKMPSKTFCNELCVETTLLRSIPNESNGVCHLVYFQLCIDLMHILPQVTAYGYDGFHHPRYAA